MNLYFYPAIIILRFGVLFNGNHTVRPTDQSWSPGRWSLASSLSAWRICDTWTAHNTALQLPGWSPFQSPHWQNNIKFANQLPIEMINRTTKSQTENYEMTVIFAMQQTVTTIRHSRMSIIKKLVIRSVS